MPFCFVRHEIALNDRGNRIALVNVILHSVENPDGAQMAYDLQKLTPHHMLHAGRYGALGMDVQSQAGLADPPRQAQGRRATGSR